jgi:hypothetical protein
MNAKKIACCTLTAMLAVVGQMSAQDSTVDAERAQRDAYRAQRDAERQLRDAERQMRDAERALQKAAQEMAAMHVDQARKLYDKRVAVYGDNARLGIVLRSERDPKTDSVGAAVQALTPGGPAEEAGLQPGDIIMKFNGEALGVPAGAVNEDAGSPTDRLMERAATLKDGDQVTLDIKRGEATKTLSVTARKLYGSRVKVFTMPEYPDPEFDVDVDVEPFEVSEAFVGPELGWMGFSSDLKGIEMLALNPDLGEYFGAKEGILVVKVPQDSPFQLKAGDVILKIGDREPKSPSQAMRVLRSYGPAETVSIEVMRNRARTTLTAHIPERKSELYRHRSEPALAPAPPAPPVPPVPPAPAAPPGHSNV